jgi:hypothetical protein
MEARARGATNIMAWIYEHMDGIIWETAMTGRVRCVCRRIYRFRVDEKQRNVNVHNLSVSNMFLKKYERYTVALLPVGRKTPFCLVSGDVNADCIVLLHQWLDSVLNYVTGYVCMCVSIFRCRQRSTPLSALSPASPWEWRIPCVVQSPMALNLISDVRWCAVNDLFFPRDQSFLGRLIETRVESYIRQFVINVSMWRAARMDVLT